MVQKGPANTREKSAMTIPASGPRAELSPTDRSSWLVGVLDGINFWAFPFYPFTVRGMRRRLSGDGRW